MQPYITYISYYKNNEYKDNMKKIQLYTILLAAPLLNGCGIYTRYARPDLDVCADSLYRTPVAKKDSGTIASKPWRELFTDPHLQTLIATGLERNTDFGIARLQVEEAQAVLTNARLSYLPSVSLAPQAGISSYNNETKKSYNIGATASWEVDLFGRVTNAQRGAAPTRKRCRHNS